MNLETSSQKESVTNNVSNNLQNEAFEYQVAKSSVKGSGIVPGAGIVDQWSLSLNKHELLVKEPGFHSKSEALPASGIARTQIVLSEAGSAFGPAVADALLGVHHVSIPFSKSITGKEQSLPIPKILESAAIGAGIGFATRTLLPQTGILGKVGSAALTVAFTAPLVKQGFDVYSDISDATTVTELRQSGMKLGTAIGSLAANLPIGIASYKLGVQASDKLMATQSMSGFASAKAKAFDAANEWAANGVDRAADFTKRFVIGDKQYSGSHAIAEQYPRISNSLENGLKGTDYVLPTAKIDPTFGKGSNVLVLTGHGVEAPEFTEVVRALRDSGAKVTVATPDWTWQYQPKNPGKVSLGQWLVNKHTIQGDVSVSQASQLMKAGKFDAMYVPGGAGNTAAIRTDSAVLDLVRQSLKQNLDTWTICHGGQVFISAEALPKGTKLTGSSDITAQDLPNAGFVVPKDPVVFDAKHKLLSGKDPSVLNEFITAIGDRLKAIQSSKHNPNPEPLFD